MDCPECGRSYPVAADVPVLIADASAVRGPMMTMEQASVVLAGLGLPADGTAPLRIRRASAARVRFPSSKSDRPADSACRLVWELLPRLAAPGSDVVARIRLQNTGAAPLRGAGEGRAMIAVRWLDPDSQAVDAGDVRTLFDADLLPGDARTIAIRLHTPQQPGHYTAELSIVEDGIRWISPPLACLPFRLQSSVPSSRPAAWLTEDPGRPAYDRAERAEQLQSWLGSGAHEPMLLEIGTGADPLSDYGLPSVMVGDDLAALQVTAAVSAEQGRDTVLLHAAVADLPFPPAYFDAVVVTSPLHSWPDPVAGLRRVCAHLRAGGFIALFGQPVGGTDPFHDMGAVGGLGQAEYARLFRQAGLNPVDAVITGDQFAARLYPEEASVD